MCVCVCVHMIPCGRSCVLTTLSFCVHICSHVSMSARSMQHVHTCTQHIEGCVGYDSCCKVCVVCSSLVVMYAPQSCFGCLVTLYLSLDNFFGLGVCYHSLSLSLSLASHTFSLCGLVVGEGNCSSQIFAPYTPNEE